MKKLLMMLVCVVCVVSSAFAFDGDIDFSSYTDDQLIQAKYALTEELVNRNIARSAIVPQGKYVVGEDIPAGVYTITTDANRNWVKFCIYSDADYTDEIWSTTPSVNNPIGKIELLDGMYIEIVRATMTFTVYTGIEFN